MAFELDRMIDFREAAESLPQGVVLCTPKIVAGSEHIDAILEQAQASLDVGVALARNRSIDLLMRITCQRQIAQATRLSGITGTTEIAIFGFSESEHAIRRAEERVRSTAKQIRRNDDLFILSDKKERYLKHLHSLPEWMTRAQLLVALKEKSALLVFSK